MQIVKKRMTPHLPFQVTQPCLSLSKCHLSTDHVSHLQQVNRLSLLEDDDFQGLAFWAGTAAAASSHSQRFSPLSPLPSPLLSTLTWRHPEATRSSNPALSYLSKKMPIKIHHLLLQEPLGFNPISPHSHQQILVSERNTSVQHPQNFRTGFSLHQQDEIVRQQGLSQLSALSIRRKASNCDSLNYIFKAIFSAFFPLHPTGYDMCSCEFLQNVTKRSCQEREEKWGKNIQLTKLFRSTLSFFSFWIICDLKKNYQRFRLRSPDILFSLLRWAGEFPYDEWPTGCQIEIIKWG